MSHRELADLLTGSPSDQPVLQMSWGVVSAATTAPNAVTVRLDGSASPTAGLRYLATYTPTVNDVVAIVQAGSDFLVIGKLA